MPFTSNSQISLIDKLVYLIEDFVDQILLNNMPLKTREKELPNVRLVSKLLQVEGNLHGYLHMLVQHHIVIFADNTSL